MEKIGEKRIHWLDAARSIAIISITFNHAVNRSFAVNEGQYIEFHSIPIYLTIIKTVIYAFSRIGVPVFVMISGTLLLPRNYEDGGARKFIKHNWLPLFITTELWLIIMFWYRQISPGSVLLTEGIWSCIIHFIMTLLFLNPVTMGSMWYMEMILCVYLMIPVLSIALKKLDFMFFLIPVGIVLFCSYILPDVNGILKTMGLQMTIETKLTSANVFSMYVILLLLGYYVAHKEALKKIKTSILMMGCAVSFIAFCIFQFWFYSREYDFVVGNGYHSVFPMLVALFLFELLRRAEIGEGISKVSTGLARISFGIYFVHICIMEGLVIVNGYFGLRLTHFWLFLYLESISFIGSVLIIKLLACRKITEHFKWMKNINRYLFGIK